MVKGVFLRGVKGHDCLYYFKLYWKQNIFLNHRTIQDGKGHQLYQSFSLSKLQLLNLLNFQKSFYHTSHSLTFLSSIIIIISSLSAPQANLRFNSIGSAWSCTCKHTRACSRYTIAAVVKREWFTRNAVVLTRNAVVLTRYAVVDIVVIQEWLPSLQ